VQRGTLLGFAAAGSAGLALLMAACGGSSRPGAAGVGTTTSAATASASPSQQDEALAFSRCMRAHGVPGYPDPDSDGNLPAFDAGVSKQALTAAGGACKRLLSNGGGSGSTQGARQKLAFGLQVARCVRAHGYPTYPDPTGSSQGSGTRFDRTGIDTKSPQFQAAETACETQARTALGLP
jgi:hypothetical protein